MVKKAYNERVHVSIAYIRDELRHNRYAGDAMEALKYLMSEYDRLWARYRSIVNPAEYTVKHVS